jgi:UPF0042 nucleotide-binding protein
MSLTIISFGYLHGAPPVADLVTDLRPYTDPHVDPAMRKLTGLDAAVIQRVHATPGIPEEILRLTVAAVRYTKGGRSATFAIGCAGGRHRSVVVANTVAALLAREVTPVATTVSHRDLSKPVVNR